MTKGARKNINDKNVTKVVQHKNLESEHGVLASMNQVRHQRKLSYAINNKNESQKREKRKDALASGPDP